MMSNISTLQAERERMAGDQFHPLTQTLSFRRRAEYGHLPNMAVTAVTTASLLLIARHSLLVLHRRPAFSVHVHWGRHHHGHVLGHRLHVIRHALCVINHRLLQFHLALHARLFRSEISDHIWHLTTRGHSRTMQGGFRAKSRCRTQRRLSALTVGIWRGQHLRQVNNGSAQP